MKNIKYFNLLRTLFFIFVLSLSLEIYPAKSQIKTKDTKLIEIVRNIKISNGEPDIQIYKTGKNRPTLYEIDIERKAFIPKEKVTFSFLLPEKINLDGISFKVELSLFDFKGIEKEKIGSIIIKNNNVKDKHIVWKVPKVPDNEYVLAAKFYDSVGKYFLSKSDIIFISSEYPKILNETKKKISETANSIKDSEWIIKEACLPSIEMIVKDAEIRWATLRKEDEDWYDIKNMLNKAMEFAEILKNGKDPFKEIRGPFIKAYRSSIDNSLQPYAVYIPDNYNSSILYPLIIGLHGATSTHVNFMNRIFGMTNKPGESDEESIKYFKRLKPVDFIIATPFGRGATNSYHGIGENDVLTVINIMKKTYNIDENRIYLTGLSMGGDGTWSIGLHYPDLFAAIAPVCAPSNPFLRKIDNIDPYYKKIAEVNSAINIAENALNLPVYIFHGDMDETVPVEHSREMVKRFKELGYFEKNIWYAEYPGVSHASWVHSYRNGKIFDWFKKFKRNPYPKHVIYKTGNSRFNKAYWLRIDEFSKIREFASIEGKIEGQNINLTTQNVDRYSILLNQNLIDLNNNINVLTNGTNAYSGKVPKSGILSFSIVKNKSGKITGYKRDDSPFQEKIFPDISGGRLFRMSSQAQISKHIYVYGTSGSQEETEFLKETAEKTADWGAESWVNWKVIKDTDVTKSDILDNNLILFGSPKSNLIIARINEKLPIRIENGIIIKGTEKFAGMDKSFKMTYLNPENKNKLVEIHCAQTKIGMKNLQSLSGVNPDYIILDENAKKITGGLFDKNWNF